MQLLRLLPGLPLVMLKDDIFTPGTKPPLPHSHADKPNWHGLLRVTTEAAEMWVLRAVHTFNKNIDALESRGKSSTTRAAVSSARVKEPQTLMNVCCLYEKWLPEWTKLLTTAELADLQAAWWSGSHAPHACGARRAARAST